MTSLHTTLSDGRADDGSEHGDDELDNALDGFFFHSFAQNKLLFFTLII